MTWNTKEKSFDQAKKQIGVSSIFFNYFDYYANPNKKQNTMSQ